MPPRFPRHTTHTRPVAPDAIRLMSERGLRAEDVDIIPGASGGPK